MSDDTHIDMRRDLEVMRDLVSEQFAPSVQVVPGIAGSPEVPFLVHGVGKTVKEITRAQVEAHSPVPFERRGTSKLQTVESLIAHALRFKDEGSAIFADADRRKPSLTTVLDYHPAGADSAPRWGRHRNSFDFPLSDEWLAWTGQDRKAMTMIEFSRFLEDNVTDVQANTADLDPQQKQFIDATGGSIASPGLLLALAANLKVNETTAVKEARNLSTGEAQIEFNSTRATEVKGDIVKVPSAFLIAIPVFKNSGDAFRILARLRYHRESQSLKFWFELWRVQPTFDVAFTEACEAVREGTGLPLFYGTPEAS